MRLFLREVPAALLIALLLGIFCALAAGALSHGSDSSYSRFKVAVVDEEGSFISGMALSMITGNPLLSNLELTKVSGEQAEEGIADGTFTAAIFLPDGFSGNYSVGNRTEARIVISDKAPLQADVLKLVASFGEDLLSTGQYGVFAGENLVIKYAPERHSAYLARSNALFVGKVITDPKIQMQTLSYGQTGVDPLNWYVLLYVMTFFLLLILGCFFITRDGSTSMLRRLNISGVRMGNYLGSKILWVGLFYLVLAVVIMVLGMSQGLMKVPESLAAAGSTVSNSGVSSSEVSNVVSASASVSANAGEAAANAASAALQGVSAESVSVAVAFWLKTILSLVISLSALLLVGMAILIILPEAPAVTAVTLLSLVGLFASGGILPRLELPEWIPVLGDLLPIGAAARGCSLLLGGSFQPLYLLISLVWAGIAYLMMRRHLVQVLRGDAGKNREKQKVTLKAKANAGAAAFMTVNRDTNSIADRNQNLMSHNGSESNENQSQNLKSHSGSDRIFNNSSNANAPVFRPSRFVSLTLALKRFLRPASIALLAAVFATVMLGQMAGHHVSLRPCGLFVEDLEGTAEELSCTAEVRDYLVGKGFVLYENRNAMEKDVSNGKLDCGAVLLKGLGKGVSQASYEETTALLLSPDSFLTQIYQAHITAALFKASSPALVYQSALDSKVPLEMAEIKEELKNLWEDGHRFTFTMTTTSGQAPLEKDYGADIALAAAALLLFAAILTETRRTVVNADVLWPRVGRSNAIGKILLPALLCPAVFYMLSALGVPSEVRAALPAYVLAITSLGLLLARLPLQIRPLVPIVLLGSLAMLPVYFDFAAMIPALSFLHYVLPPCWLLKMKDAPLLSTWISLGLTAAVIAFYPQKKVK